MANLRDSRWEDNSEVYSEDQVDAVLKECGLDVREETDHDFISFCPYHGNRDTPAFSVSKSSGKFLCFNPSCGEYGPLEKLVRDTKRLNHFEAKRLIHLKKVTDVPFKERFDSGKAPSEEFKEFPASLLQRYTDSLWDGGHDVALDYLRGRGFEDRTLKHFNVGWSPVFPKYHRPELVVVPMYEPRGTPIGLIGRTFEGEKAFKNSKGLPKSRTPWNLNNARRYETCIITESTFDAMRVHQAGYPNVIALLGGSLSEEHEYLFKRYFTRLVIMTDNDKPQYHRGCKKCARKKFEMCQGHQPGRDLGMQIADRLTTMRVSWAAYDDESIYPRDAKDVCDMTDDEIRQCLKNAVSHNDYLEWQVD